jgi:tripartite-type tricarboxylate transporter receptor subunit TctC
MWQGSRALLAKLVCTFMLAALAAAAGAQAYPTKPIRLIVPFPPGSGLDTMGRMVASKMGEQFGQPVVVENRAGANGAIGLENAARSAPDGYTLVLGTSSTHGSAPYSTKNLPYDPVRDFTPIATAVTTVIVIAAANNFPVNTIRELIDYAKRNPGKVTYSTSGVGGALHMVAEMFEAQFGVDLVHVPYKGSAPAITAVVAGEVNVGFNGTSESVRLAKTGKLKILAAAESERFPGLPDTPALAELLPGYERPPGWFAFFGPAGIPGTVVQRLNEAIVKALKAPDVAAKLEAQGLFVVAGRPEHLANLVKRSLVLYGQAAKLAGLKPE